MKASLSPVKQARLNQLLDDATKLLIERPNASLAEIAEFAGIGIATLHRYVENREQLMLLLGFRAIQVVEETIRKLRLDEEHCERYIPDLIGGLIPLGDKIYFLAHDASVNANSELEQAYLRVTEPIRDVFGVLQQKGLLRSPMNLDWMIEVLYSLLFLTWQQIYTGQLARNSAAQLLLDTYSNGFAVRRE